MKSLMTAERVTAALTLLLASLAVIAVLAVDERIYAAAAMIAASVSAAWAFAVATRRERRLETLHAASKTQSAEREAAKLAAVNESMRVLAHDVRKPFSLMKMGLRMLRSERDPERQADLIDRLSHEVEQSLETVNGLIHDMIRGEPSKSARPVETRNLRLVDIEQPQRRASEREATRSIAEAYERTHERLKVLVVDDEPLYSEAIYGLICEDEALAEAVEFQAVTSGSAALSLANGDGSPHVIVCDIDLGRDTIDGYETVSALRQGGVTAKICIHSNRALPSDYEKAIQVGADAFLPKPMSRAHLLRLLASARDTKPAVKKDSPASRSAAASGKPCFALIDDDVFILEAWQMSLEGEADVLTYTTPEAFWKALADDPGLQERLAFVITDYYFDDAYQGNGVSFAKELKDRLSVPIVLSSDGIFAREETAIFAAVISKTPQSVAELRRISGA